MNHLAQMASWMGCVLLAIAVVAYWIKTRSNWYSQGKEMLEQHGTLFFFFHLLLGLEVI